MRLTFYVYFNIVSGAKPIIYTKKHIRKIPSRLRMITGILVYF